MSRMLASRPSQQFLPSTVSRASVRLGTDHVFVNNVRFWSMLAIIAVHSLVIDGEIRPEPGLARNLQVLLLQALKFGTVGFFFSAGFLLGERLPQSSGPRYFWRRLRRVGGPWALWASLYVVLPFVHALASHRRLLAHSTAWGSALQQRVLDVLFSSSYWFVPNFLLALALLLLGKRYLDDLRFGALLLGLSLFYGVNVYYQWIPSRHTAALFGFVFYLWLGHWTCRHFSLVSGLLRRTPAPVLLSALGLAGSVAVAEAHVLSRFHSDDMMNSLRISNQVFSVLIVLVFLKTRRVTWPRWINVRTTTFGLYLIHPTLALVLHSLVSSMNAYLLSSRWGSMVSRFDPFTAHPLTSLGVWAATFGAYYGGSLLLTQTLVRWPGLRWTVGQ